MRSIAIFFLLMAVAGVAYAGSACDAEVTIKAGYGIERYSEKYSTGGQQIEGEADIPVVEVELSQRHYSETNRAYFGYGIVLTSSIDPEQMNWTANGTQLFNNSVLISGPAGLGIISPRLEVGTDLCSIGCGTSIRLFAGASYDIHMLKYNSYYDISSATIIDRPQHVIRELPTLSVGVEAKIYAESGIGVLFGTRYDYIVAGRSETSLANGSEDISGDTLTVKTAVSFTGKNIWSIGIEYSILNLNGAGVKDKLGNLVAYPDVDSEGLMGFIEVVF